MPTHTHVNVMLTDADREYLSHLLDMASEQAGSRIARESVAALAGNLLPDPPLDVTVVHDHNTQGVPYVQLGCPYCGIAGRIVEVDSAVRFNVLPVAHYDDDPAKPLVVTPRPRPQGPEWEHYLFQCEDCERTVTVPTTIDVSYG